MYDMKDVLAVIIVGVMAFVAIVVCYIIEAALLGKVASKRGENPLFAWIPVLNYFLLRDMAGKKRRWQWLVAFLAAALLGNSVISFIGTQAFVWSMVVWYFSAFHTLMEEETELDTLWFMGAIFFFPVRLYIMYRMTE